ncbi:MAG: energy transducer TonB [Orrella sp.]
MLAVTVHLSLVVTFWALQRLVTTEKTEQEFIDVELIAFSPEPSQAVAEPVEAAAPEPEPEPETLPTPEPQPEPIPEPEPESEPVPEPVQKPEPVLVPEPEIASVQSFEPDIKAATAPEQTLASEPELIPEPEPVPEPVVVPKPVAVKPKATKPVAVTPRATKVAPPRESSVATRTSTPAVFDADYLNNPAPRYPTSAFRQRAEGTVVVRAEILANGQSGRIELQRSSGFDSLDAAALSTIKKWRFKPAMVDGKAISQWVTIPITFRLTKR